MPERTVTTDALATVLTQDPERIFSDLAENVAALVGVGVSIETLPSDAATLGPLFGNKNVYLFPIEETAQQPLPALMALDIPGAASMGGALIMMPADAIKQALSTQKIPDMLHDSIGEVANIIVGAVQQILAKDRGGTVEFRRGMNFRQFKPGKWPALLHEVDKTLPWSLAAGRVLFDGEEKGVLLVGSATPDGASVAAAPSAGEATAGIGAAEHGSSDATRPSTAPLPIADLGAVPSGLKVQVAGFPADTGAVALRQLLERFPVQLLPLYAGLTTVQPDLLLVVSRSHTDIKLRLGALAQSGRRPAMVIACSDRPTREIVLAARVGGADDFLVLPADVARVKQLLVKVPVPA